MIKLHWLNEIQDIKKYEYCKENYKKLDTLFDTCMKENNNKIQKCQDLRYKLERCIQIIKDRKDFEN